MYYKSYRYRLYPNKEQEVLLTKHFDACRFIYNHFLEQKIKHYKETKKTLGWTKQIINLPPLKDKIPWLKEVNAQSLQQSILNLDHAYTAFFRSNKGFPNFKSKKCSKKAFKCTEDIRIDPEQNKIKLPKFIKLKNKNKDNRIKCKFDRQIKEGEKIKQATVSQNKSGNYFVSFLVEIDKELPPKPATNRKTSIGLDFGLKNFITDSNGNIVVAPKYFEKSKDKLKKHQQELEKLKENSTALKSKREQITKLYQKITNQRKDFLDKLSHRLTHESQVDTLCIEDLSISKMQEKGWKGLNRSIDDSGWFNFTKMLEYKTNWYGKNLIKIGRFDPSSKTCSKCGWIKHDLELKDRKWTCGDCSAMHDRDVNAAKNILDFAFHKMGFPKGRDYPIEAFSLY